MFMMGEAGQLSSTSGTWPRRDGVTRAPHVVGHGALPVRAALVGWAVVALVVVDTVDGLWASSVALGLLVQPFVLVGAARALHHGAGRGPAEDHGGDPGDESERALIEAELRRDEEKLHEVRSTVAGIAVATQLLHHAPASMPQATLERLWRMQETELERLERLVTPGPSITDGVPHAAPEATPGSAEEVVDLDAVVEHLAVAREARGEDVRWAPSGLAAQASRDHVTEVVHTLLDNAARHAPGATVHVATEEAEDGTVHLRVRDEGPGVAPTVLDRVFEWGARGPDSPGTGIGLAAARDRAHADGGALILESTGSAGTTFRLSLPAPRWFSAGR